MSVRICCDRCQGPVTTAWPYAEITYQTMNGASAVYHLCKTCLHHLGLSPGSLGWVPKP